MLHLKYVLTCEPKRAQKSTSPSPAILSYQRPGTLQAARLFLRLVIFLTVAQFSIQRLFRCPHTNHASLACRPKEAT